MCDPVTALTAVSTVLSIGGAVSQFSQQKQMAKQNTANSLRAYENTNADLTNRQIQEQNAAAQQTFEQQREYAGANAHAIVAADNSGVQGISVDGLLADLAGQQARRQDTVGQNLSMSVDQLQRERVGAAAARDSSIASTPKPSALALAINIGGQAANGYLTAKRRTTPTGG